MAAAMAETVCGAAGCENPGTKLCSRCGGEAYCSAECQRRAWKAHKQVCQRQDTPENAVAEHLRAGRLYSAREALRQLPKPSARLEDELEERIKAGIHSEIVDGRLRLENVEGFGKGYVAARDLAEGEALLFDTAFASAPTDGAKEFFFLIAEKAMRRGKSGSRRTSARADAQADFYYDVVKALPLKGNMDRAWLESTEDEEMREQLLVCSAAEGSCLYCSEEPGHLALFAAAAWFNHSCAPNASLESTRSTALVRAAAAIPEGAEVTLSYLPSALLSEPASSRRERLEAGRGFVCRCARCLAEAGEPAAEPMSAPDEGA